MAALSAVAVGRPVAMINCTAYHLLGNACAFFFLCVHCIVVGHVRGCPVRSDAQNEGPLSSRALRRRPSVPLMDFELRRLRFERSISGEHPTTQ